MRRTSPFSGDAADDAGASSGPLRVGVIGLGEMGLPMARRLHARWPTAVYDISPTAREAAAAEGLEATARARELADRSDVVVIMVPSRFVGEVVSGEDGLLGARLRGLIVIEGGNSDPRKSVQFADLFHAAGAAFLDVGFSGGPLGAGAGTLAVMVGGDQRAYETALPVLETLGREIGYFGASGNGHLAKALNHLVQGLTAQAIGEALAIAESAGIDPADWVRVVSDGAAASWLMDRARDMLGGAAADGERVSQWWSSLGGRNQLTYAMEYATTNGLATPLAAIGQQVRALSLLPERSPAMQNYVNLTWELAHLRRPLVEHGPREHRGADVHEGGAPECSDGDGDGEQDD